MKIFIVTPSFAIHGGIRIIMEWANRLTEFHEVYLHSQKGDFCNWFDISPQVRQTEHGGMAGMDCLIITSPHNIEFQNRPDTPPKVFIFAQMAEHLFMKPSDAMYGTWYKQCLNFYTSKNPMILISQWNKELFEEMGRRSTMHYVDNGVNFEHFPISYAKKEPKTVLIEGWECMNPSKDSNNIGPKVAQRLKNEGYRIIAYSQKRIKTMPGVPDEYYVRPTLEQMNELYQRASIMIKATHYDARSCSPLEAMVKGCVTVRAIEKGDDDLQNGVNCHRTRYSEQELYQGCKYVLDRPAYLNRLAKASRLWVQENCNWDDIIIKIEAILNSDGK